jgi:hypothetical protein
MFFFFLVDYPIRFSKLLTFVSYFVFNVVTFVLGFVITFYNFGVLSGSNKFIQLSFSLLLFLLQPMDEEQVRVLFMMGCLMTFHIMDENFKKTCFFFL